MFRMFVADSEFNIYRTADDRYAAPMLGVPLLREGVSDGVTCRLQRRHLRPFTEKQIELPRPSQTKP